MLKAKDYRSLARNHLGGGFTAKVWGGFAVVALICFIAEGLVAAFSFGLIWLVVAGPVSLGIATVSLRVVRGGEADVYDLFRGFENFTTSFLVYLLNNIFIFLWSLLFIVPGIIKSYAYSMSFFVLRDNPALTATEARKMSIELMRGNKWRYFCLNFSFIGWHILSVLTLGILYIWVYPYILTACAEFYESILPKAPAGRI